MALTYSNPYALSWFLVQLDKPTVINIGGKEKSLLCIVPSLNIIDYDSSEMYFGRRIAFDLKNSRLEGKIIFNSDDLSQVKRQMSIQMANVQCPLIENRQVRENMYYLVQYSTSPNNFVHSVMCGDEFEPRNNEVLGDNEVFVFVNDMKCRATILFSAAEESKLDEELLKLRSKFLHVYFDEDDKVDDMSDNPWLLLQFCYEKQHVIHLILQHKETVWDFQNKYPHVVAYLKSGDGVYQATILRKHSNREELDEELEKMRKSCGEENFPLKLDDNIGIVNPLLMDRCVKLDEEEQTSEDSEPMQTGESSGNEQKNSEPMKTNEREGNDCIFLLKLLDNIQMTMGHDVASIFANFNSLDSVRQALEGIEAKI